MVNSYSSEPWHLTVVRSQGVHQLRPEKSWRPIVQLTVQQRPPYEVMLGSDGQNPNLKKPFVVHDASHQSRVEIHVCYQSQTKKKSKRRCVVAKADISLGELLKRQESNKTAEVRLTCLSQSVRRTYSGGSGRGQSRSSSVLHVHVRPPQTAPSRTPTFDHDTSDDDGRSHTSEGALSETLSCTSAVEKSTEPTWDEEHSEPEPGLRRRKNKKSRRYHLFSDSECGSEDSVLSDGSLGDEHVEEGSLLGDDLDDSFERTFVDAEDGKDYSVNFVIWRATTWIAASFLPLYTDQISVVSQKSRSLGTSVLDVISPYHRLNNADGYAEIEKIMKDLQSEWSYVGASLIALAAVDSAVFGLAPGSIFPVNGLAQHAIAAGGLASGLGLAIDAWFMLKYNCTDARKFQTRALGIWDNYTFFCISCRLPALFLLISAMALFVFLFCVAFTVWPVASTAMCFVAGFLVTLQYLAYAGYLFVWFVIGCGFAVQRFVRNVCASVVLRWRGSTTDSEKKTEA